MSIRQLAEVWYTPTLAPNQRLVAAALADYADDHGRCFPSLKNIAAKVGYSVRNTQRIVGELKSLGYLEILIEATYNRTPLYQLHPEVLKPYERIDQPDLPMLPDIDAVEQALVAAAKRRGDKMSPPDTRGDQGRQDVIPGVTPEAPRGDTDVTLNRQEPSEEPSSEPLLAGNGDTIVGNVELELHADGTAEIIRDDFELKKPPRPRNLGWDALEDVFGYRAQNHEASLWGRIAARANEEPDPEAAVKIRAQRLIQQWGVAKLTPASLDKWWDRFGSPLGAATDADVERMRDDHEKLERRRRAAELEETKPIEGRTP